MSGSPRSLQTQILLTIGILCTLLAIIGGGYFFSLRAIKASYNTEHNHLEGELKISNEIAKDIRSNEILILRRITNGDVSNSRSFDQDIRDYQASIVEKMKLYRTIVDTDEEKRIIDRLEQTWKVYQQETEHLLSLSHQDSNTDAFKKTISSHEITFGNFLQVIDEMTHNADLETDELNNATGRLIYRIEVGANFMIALAVLIAIWTGIQIKKMGRQLREDNARLEKEIIERRKATFELDRMVTLSPDMIFTAGFDGYLKKINSAFEQILGFSEKELLNEPFMNFTHPDDLAAVADSMARCKAEGRLLGIEVRSRCKDGSFKWLQFNSVVSLDEQVYYCVGRDISARKEAEEQLERLRSEHRLILNSIGEGVHWVGLDGNIKFENPAAAKMLGYEISELIGLPAHATMHHKKRDGSPYPTCECPIYTSIRDGERRTVLNEVFWRKDGSCFPVEYTCTPVRDDHGCLAGTVVIFTDVTERKRLEAQLLQSQKMETVGKLAGGIAHEFNSILTAIIGQSELLLGDLPPDHPLSSNATEIRRAADRAALLTRQLLAYGRKQILQPEILDLNKVLLDSEPMIRHLLGPDVDVRVLPTAGLNPVRVDAGQIEQVIMNMALNAGQAMPNGGTLTLETAHIFFSEGQVSGYPELKPGPYAVLAITDAGTGMSAEVRSRIFEPFFSTREIGQGTGLGLATCYGIVKQSGGHISVYSEMGRGSTFKIYLPQQVPQAADSAPPPKKESPLSRGTETILLVEDDPALRGMAGQLLQRLGYDVLSASNGTEALKVAKQQGNKTIHLLFTDVVMPQTNGKDLADLIQAFHPGIKILFTSAFTENAIVHQGMLDRDVFLIPKPFTPSELARKIREVLSFSKT